MRRQSDRKRQVILDAAYSLFREKGFEGASMSEICARAGGSKGTIYNYFDSKEKLFVDCMFRIAERYLDAVFCELVSPTDDVRLALQTFGERYLRAVCAPEMVSARRLAISEADRAGIGPQFHEKLIRVRQNVTAFLSAAMASGALSGGDAVLAARQLRALLEAELFESLLLCATPAYPNERMMVEAATRAVETFMCAYASAPQPAKSARQEPDDVGVRGAKAGGTRDDKAH